MKGQKEKLKIIAALVFVVAIFVYFGFHGAPSIKNISAQTTLTPLSGYAWSSNIGWISLTGSNYGAQIDPATGAFSGYGWSSNIGWINFNPTASSAPEPPLKGATLNLTTKAVEGWAQAVTPTLAGASAGGWDGWIKMSGVSYNPSTKTFSGYAWGGDVVGWISFNGVSVGGSNSKLAIVVSKGHNMKGGDTSAAIADYYTDSTNFVDVTTSSQTLWDSSDSSCATVVKNPNNVVVTANATKDCSVNIAATSSLGSYPVRSAIYPIAIRQPTSEGGGVIICSGSNGVCDNGGRTGDVDNQMKKYLASISSTAKYIATVEQIYESAAGTCRKLGNPDFFWSPATITVYNSILFVSTYDSAVATAAPSKIAWTFSPNAVPPSFSGDFNTASSTAAKFGPGGNSRNITLKVFKGNDYCEFDKTITASGEIEY